MDLEVWRDRASLLTFGEETQGSIYHFTYNGAAAVSSVHLLPLFGWGAPQYHSPQI